LSLVMAKASAGTGDSIHELKITLCGPKPPVWRRFAVPSDVTLAELHEIAQIVMGWEDCHMHDFRLKTGKRKPDPHELASLMCAGRWDEIATANRSERIFNDAGFDGLDGEDEDLVALGELCPRPKAKLVYEYDFGDGWEHTIEVIRVHGAEPNTRYPKCLAGKRACPPEDSGGVWGYYAKLEALADPKHPDHEDVAEWMDPEFDPAAFDIDEVNQLLGDWRRHSRRRRSGGKGGHNRKK